MTAPWHLGWPTVALQSNPQLRPYVPGGQFSSSKTTCNNNLFCKIFLTSSLLTCQACLTSPITYKRLVFVTNYLTRHVKIPLCRDFEIDINTSSFKICKKYKIISLSIWLLDIRYWVFFKSLRSISSSLLNQRCGPIS